MIAKLTGTVVDISDTSIVLDVAGVGYLIAVRSPSEFTLKEEASLSTYLAVRDTALDLYGFKLKDELDMFRLLIKLPKIGPKSALQILVHADIPLLKKAIANEDPSYLSKMSGVGKKSAEKIVAGLKGKIDLTGIDISDDSETTDVVDALITLGYSQKEAREVVQNLPKDTGDVNSKISAALKVLSS